MTDEDLLDRVAYVQNGRPKFFDDPVNDQLLAMVMTLLGEVTVLRDRIDTHERLAAAQGLWSRDEVDAYVPDAPVTAERGCERQALMDRVLKVLTEDVIRARYE